MNNTNLTIDSSLLDVELPQQLHTVASVSTFLPEEEASVCPLLSSSTSGTFSQPVTTGCNDDDNIDSNLNSDISTSAHFNKHYHHLETGNGVQEDVITRAMDMKIDFVKDATPFMSWNWPFIRKITFYGFMSGLFAMCAVVLALIITLPKTCNPKTAWYRGTVIYEIFPADFHDTNNDGIGDIRGIVKQIEFFRILGVGAVRLNSIFTSPNYPNDYENISSLTKIANVLGQQDDLLHLSQSLHAYNISLILDLPLAPFLKNLKEEKIQHLQLDEFDQHQKQNNTTINLHGNIITTALEKWIGYGVDGFYVKGIENYFNAIELKHHLKTFKNVMGPNCVLIINESVLKNFNDHEKIDILKNVDLVDVYIDIYNDTKYIERCINNILSGSLAPTDSGTWISWSFRKTDKTDVNSLNNNSNITLAATIMQIMLPGTPNLFHNKFELKNDNFEKMQKNENSLYNAKSSSELFQNKVENLQIISKIIKLRERSPSIYKNSICKMDSNLPNTKVHHSLNDILVIERTFPRRNTYISVSNFGNKHVTMDLSSMYYSGQQILKDHNKVMFKIFELAPFETSIIKLDK